MNNQLSRAEILAAHAMQGNPHYKWAAAKDLLNAAADLLADSDEGQMANHLAVLLSWESAPFRDCDADDCDAAAERVCELADNLGKRFTAIADRVAS